MSSSGPTVKMGTEEFPFCGIMNCTLGNEQGCRRLAFPFENLKSATATWGKVLGCTNGCTNVLMVVQQNSALRQVQASRLTCEWFLRNFSGSILRDCTEFGFSCRPLKLDASRKRALSLVDGGRAPFFYSPAFPAHNIPFVSIVLFIIYSGFQLLDTAYSHSR